jgi:hypothetical protein
MQKATLWSFSKRMPEYASLGLVRAQQQQPAVSTAAERACVLPAAGGCQKYA